MGETIGFVFARGGSKGLPRKNLRLLGGRPLIAHAVACAIATPSIDRVVVSTDDEEIAEAAQQAGAEVPFLRPAELSMDDSSEWKAWQHAIRWMTEEEGASIERFVCLPATAPLRAVEDVETCIELFDEGGADLVLTVTESPVNPYFNMVVIDDGFARLGIQPEQEVQHRQEAPSVWRITPVAYVAPPAFILSAPGVFAGRVRASFVPADRAVDIDSELDFQFAELLLARRGEPS